MPRPPGRRALARLAPHAPAHSHVVPARPPRSEFSLGAASLADSLGVAAADAVGILIQGCLFRVNRLPGADFKC